MPSLSQHQSSTITKMLYLGDSGAGKTGSLASLAKAGYNLRIIDFDNGLDILTKLLWDDKEALNRVRFKTFTDKMKMVGQTFQPDGIPVAFTNAMKTLNGWKDEDEDLGPVTKWGDKDVLVIDSMTLMGECIKRHILHVNGRSGQNLTQPNWGEAMRMMEDFFTLLYSDAVKCNVIVLSHVVHLGDENIGLQGYPSALGNKLPPKIPRYFNTMVCAETRGAGAGQKRIIRTRSKMGLELKVANPAILETLPLESGLATIFDMMRKG